MTYKAVFCILAGAIGGIITYIMGGWSIALTILVICMAIDYGSGLFVAGVFHASPKSMGGGLDRNVGWKGLVRKVATLVIILIAHFVDMLLGTEYIRDAVVIAFTINEILSILENCALMGVPIPKVLLKGIDILKEQAGKDNDEKPPDQTQAADGEKEVPNDDAG